MTPSGSPRRVGRGDLFPETSRTMIRDLCMGGERGAAALERFAGRYYRPTRAYIAAIVLDKTMVDDLTQKFFTTKVLDGGLLAKYNPKLGRLRPFLKQSVRFFLIDEQRAAKADILGTPAVRPDSHNPDWDVVVRELSPAPDEAFHREWVRALVAEALATIEELCRSKGQEQHLKLFRGRHLDPSGRIPSWRELGAPVGLSEKDARTRAETAARHFRNAVWNILVDELGSEEAAEEELATLFSLL